MPRERQPGPLKYPNLETFETNIKTITKEIPDPHGFPHIQIVTSYCLYLCHTQGLSPKLGRVGALIHDLRYQEGAEREERKIVRDKRQSGLPKTSEILAALIDSGIINYREASEIMRAVRYHDRLPQNTQASREASKGRIDRQINVSSPLVDILTDADRLSRIADIEGIMHVFETNQDNGYPLRQPDLPIEKVEPHTFESHQITFTDKDGVEKKKHVSISILDSAPLIPFADLNRADTDFRSCLQWFSIMQTREGFNMAKRSLALGNTLIDTMNANPEMTYETLIGWLRSLVDNQKESREKLRQLALDPTKTSEFRALHDQLNHPTFLTNEKYHAYLQETKRQLDNEQRLLRALAHSNQIPPKLQ